MRIWRKMVMSWDFRISNGLKTNVMKTKLQKKDEECPIRIWRMQAIAMPENKGRLTIDISFAEGPSGKRRGDPMLTKLEKFDRGAKQFELHTNLKSGPWIGKEKPFSRIYFLEFEFENIEEFPDTVLRIVQELWRLLDIEDESSHHIADFKLVESTFVELESDQWISLARFWKIEQRLPHWTVEDMRPRR